MCQGRFAAHSQHTTSQDHLRQSSTAVLGGKGVARLASSTLSSVNSIQDSVCMRPNLRPCRPHNVRPIGSSLGVPGPLPAHPGRAEAPTASRSWSTSNRRILPSPLRSVRYGPGSTCRCHHTRYPTYPRLAVAPSAIRHPQCPQKPQHPCRPCAQSPASSARLVSSLLFPCFAFATRPAQHCSDAPWRGAAAEETARLVPPWHFCARTRPLQSMPDLARPCRIIQHTGPHGATRPGRGVCHNRNPSAMSSPASLCLVSSSTPLW